MRIDREQIATWVAASPILIFVFAGVASTWLGYWWRIAFVLVSPVAGTLAAQRAGERWPVMHPIFGLFFSCPAILALISGLLWPVIGLLTQPVLEWGQWFFWSCVLAGAITAVAAYLWRGAHRPKGALFWTFAALAVPALVGLDSANTSLPQGNPRVAEASIQSTFPGGSRQLGPTVSIDGSVGGHSATHAVSWSVYRAATEGKKAMCTCTYPGALGWSWMRLSVCPSVTR